MSVGDDKKDVFFEGRECMHEHAFLLWLLCLELCVRSTQIFLLTSPFPPIHHKYSLSHSLSIYICMHLAVVFKLRALNYIASLVFILLSQSKFFIYNTLINSKKV